jgi:pentatricopeptide repeat protein
LAAFEQLKSEGLTPDQYSYSNLINAYINSGDVDGGCAAFAAMVAADFQPNCIIYTTLLKGHAAAGSVTKAEALLDQMGAQDPPIRPDVRAINTFMRGCIRVGDLAAAERVLARMEEPAWVVKPDGGTHRVLVRLLSQNLRLADVKALLRERRDADKVDVKAAAAQVAAADDDVGAVVRLRGLPFVATLESITRWLVLAVRDVSIVTVPSTKGLGPKPTGEAFVELASALDASTAINDHHRRLMGERYVEVYAATLSEMQASKAGKGAVKACSFWAAGKCDRGVNCQFYHDPGVVQLAAQQQHVDKLDHDMAMHVDMAHAAAALGKWAVCRKALSRASNTEAEAEVAAAKVLHSDENTKAALFQQMRRRELSLEHARISRFVEAQDVADLPGCLGRVFVFSSSLEALVAAAGDGDTSACTVAGGAPAKEVRRRLLEALRATMGLDETVLRELTTLPAAKKRLKRCISEDGAVLRWCVGRLSQGIPRWTCGFLPCAQ